MLILRTALKPQAAELLLLPFNGRTIILLLTPFSPLGVPDQRIPALGSSSVAARHIVFLVLVYSVCVCLAYAVQVCVLSIGL